jgi:hypothetical protein
VASPLPRRRPLKEEESRDRLTPRWLSSRKKARAPVTRLFALALEPSGAAGIIDRGVLSSRRFTSPHHVRLQWTAVVRILVAGQPIENYFGPVVTWAPTGLSGKGTGPWRPSGHVCPCWRGVGLGRPPRSTFGRHPEPVISLATGF